MSGNGEVSSRFLELHRGNAPLLLPNPWDVGTARLLAWLGFSALATTSSGFAATLGRRDGVATADQALQHAATIVDAVDLPVSADLENGYAHDAESVAGVVSAAARIGLAGCSIEDFTGEDDAPVYEREHAAERIAAAAEAAHVGTQCLVLTARSENYLHGRPDLADTIARLQAFQEAGADVLYAPGVSGPSEIASIISSVDVPLNVLLLPHGPTVAELTTLGVRRISVGGTFAYATIGSLVEAGRELLAGSAEFFDRAAIGRTAVEEAFQ